MGFKCTNCHGNATYDIATGKVVCEHCGHSFDADEINVGKDAELINEEFVNGEFAGEELVVENKNKEFETLPTRPQDQFLVKEEDIKSILKEIESISNIDSITFRSKDEIKNT